MKQTGVKKYRRTAAMLAATFTALLAVSSFSFVQAEENTEISFPALEEIPFADMLKDLDRLYGTVLGTAFAAELWREQIDFYRAFYRKLADQLANSTFPAEC